MRRLLGFPGEGARLKGQRGFYCFPAFLRGKKSVRGVRFTAGVVDCMLWSRQYNLDFVVMVLTRSRKYVGDHNVRRGLREYHCRPRVIEEIPVYVIYSIYMRLKYTRHVVEGPSK